MGITSDPTPGHKTMLELSASLSSLLASSKIDISPVILILGLMFFRNLVFEMFAPGLFLR